MNILVLQISFLKREKLTNFILKLLFLFNINELVELKHQV